MSDSDWEESEDAVVVVAPPSSLVQRPPWRPDLSYQNTNIRSFVPGGGRPNGPRGRGRGRGFRDKEISQSWRTRGDSLIVTVDTHEVGRIIGRGGAKIKSLESESGARIKVLKDEDAGFGKTNIEINGSNHSKKLAQKLIDGLTGGFTRREPDQS
jgi:hypothetical protein